MSRFVPTPPWCTYPAYKARLQRRYNPRKNRKEVWGKFGVREVLCRSGLVTLGNWSSGTGQNGFRGTGGMWNIKKQSVFWGYS